MPSATCVPTKPGALAKPEPAPKSPASPKARMAEAGILSWPFKVTLDPRTSFNACCVNSAATPVTRLPCDKSRTAPAKSRRLFIRWYSRCSPREDSPASIALSAILASSRFTLSWTSTLRISEARRSISATSVSDRSRSSSSALFFTSSRWSTYCDRNACRSLIGRSVIFFFLFSTRKYLGVLVRRISYCARVY